MGAAASAPGVAPLAVSRPAAAVPLSPASAGATPYGTPMPPTPHVRLTSMLGAPAASLPPLRGAGRVVIVGDVHGCPRELQHLLAKVGFAGGVDNLLLVGDLVGKGPEPLEVIRLARQYGAITTRGNHDDAALAAYQALSKGVDVPKKHAWAAALVGEPGALEYLRSLPFSVSLPQIGVTVVHAGLIPGIPTDSQPLAALYKMRDLRRTGGGGDNYGGWEWLEKGHGVEGAHKWAGKWEGPTHVFFGHDARRGLQKEDAATGLDTGCVYGGQLTAAVLPPLDELAASKHLRKRLEKGEAPSLKDLEAELVSVDAEKEYAPPKGD